MTGAQLGRDVLGGAVHHPLAALVVAVLAYAGWRVATYTSRLPQAARTSRLDWVALPAVAVVVYLAMRGTHPTPPTPVRPVNRTTITHVTDHVTRSASFWTSWEFPTVVGIVAVTALAAWLNRRRRES